jgi:predicted nucleotidyltransferase
MPTAGWYWSSKPAARSCESEARAGEMRAERKQGDKEALGCRPLPVGIAACYIALMNCSEALETLRRSEQALRGRGVKHAALFGSVARGDNRSDSDIDIMIEIDPDARITVFDYVDLKEYIAALFDEPVDVVNRESLKPYVRPSATAGAIYAF